MDKKSYTFEEIKQKMVNYCVYQDRCHKEVENKMWDFLLIPEARDEIFLYLLQENYLNEERFAKSYARGKFYQKNWGKVKITGQLKFKGITSKLIQKALLEIDDDDYDETLKKLYQQHYTLQSAGKDFMKHQKTTKFLLGKGFEFEAVLRTKNEISDHK